MKARKIGYWATTSIVAVMMAFTGIFWIAQPAAALAIFTHIGFPSYFRVFLAVAKLLGGTALMYKRFPRITEWAYAGFAFLFLGATWANLNVGDTVQASGPLVFLVLLAVSYRLREQAPVVQDRGGSVYE